jgi:hypothetical protein
MKKLFSTVLITSILTAQLFAATNGSIAISASVPEISAIQASNTGAVTIDQLGNQVYSNVKVGKITIDSNDTSGFTLTYDSATDGVLSVGGSTDSDQSIAYTISLSNQSGTLGDGLSGSGLTDASPEGGQATFSGSDSSPTDGCKFDVGISAAVKGLLQGTYTDTLTITIANI